MQLAMIGLRRMGASMVRRLIAKGHECVDKREFAVDAETTALRRPELYQYEMNLPEIAEVWRRGSVIRSWRVDLIAGPLQTLQKDAQLTAYAGRVSGAGKGRWTIETAIDEAVPTHVPSAALVERFSSCGQADFLHQVLSAMRHGCGGHVETQARGKT